MRSGDTGPSHLPFAGAGLEGAFCYWCFSFLQKYFVGFYQMDICEGRGSGDCTDRQGAESIVGYHRGSQ